MSSVYTVRKEPERRLREQLRLFAFDDSDDHSTELRLIKNQLAVRDRLTTLLHGELNFTVRTAATPHTTSTRSPRSFLPSCPESLSGV